MEKRQIPIIALAVFSIVILLAQNNLPNVFAFTVRFSEAISATSNVIQETSTGFFYYFDDTNNKFGKVRTSDGIQIFEANVSSNATRGFRCNDDSCWHLTDNTASSGRLTRYSGTTGALSQGYTTNALTSGTSDIGISSSTVYVGKKCTTGEIGSSGSGDTDLAIFSIDGDNMAGDMVQHTDCGSNFSVISSASQGVIGFIRNGQFLMVVINGAAGGSEQVKAVNLNQVLTSVNNPHTCSVTLASGHNAFSSRSGGNLKADGSYVFLASLNGADGDLDVDRVLTTTCALTTFDFEDVLTGSQNGFDISTNNEQIYFTYQNPSSGDFVLASFNYTVATNSPVPSAKNFDIILTSAGFTPYYISSIDTIVLSQQNKITYIELGGVIVEPEEGNQEDGFCGLGTLRDCLGSQSALSGLVPANQNVTSIGTIIGQGIGLIDPNNENPRTNGVGLFYMLITGSFFAIALITTVHTLNMRGFISASVKEIDPIFWLFLVVGTVSVAWYLDWIDDIIFAAMTVGLAGLISFGVLKHFGRV